MIRYIIPIGLLFTCGVKAMDNAFTNSNVILDQHDGSVISVKDIVNLVNDLGRLGDIEDYQKVVDFVKSVNMSDEDETEYLELSKRYCDLKTDFYSRCIVSEQKRKICEKYDLDYLKQEYHSTYPFYIFMRENPDNVIVKNVQKKIKELGWMVSDELRCTHSFTVQGIGWQKPSILIDIEPISGRDGIIDCINIDFIKNKLRWQ